MGLSSAGFEIIAGLDNEEKYISSFKHNFPKAKALSVDITTISPYDFMEMVEIIPKEIDLLVGGPPCQGFSKNVPRKKRYLEDPKNMLVKSFLDFCTIIQPKMILMENVAEMKNGFEEAYSREIINRLQEDGYTVSSMVLNASDFGIPQHRKRAFFLANKFGIQFDMPYPTHTQKKTSKILKGLFESFPKLTVWDAISDLPSLIHGNGHEIAVYASEPRTEYQKLMRRGVDRVKNHVARKLSSIQFERLSSIGPGQGNRDLPKHLQTKGAYSGAYGRLTWDMIAPTITKWVFHTGSGRWGHPTDIRTLTIREVARIQSFPDSFEFVGSYIEQAGQVGNAVPPLLIETIAKSMISQLGSIQKVS